jgi:CheY-like chemotaxis protein/HPt (histidine-containing phosphotransfer) domain-containing protein
VAQVNNLAKRLDLTVVIHDDEPGDDHEAAIQRSGLAMSDRVRHLLIGAERRGPAAVVGPTVGHLGRLRCHELWRGVAMVAGRRSPELVHACDDLELLIGLDVAAALTAGKPHGPRILIAEDDLTNRQVIARQMAMLGFEAEIAADGAQALAMWRSRPYALLLTDLHMPVMDGYELTASIRAQESECGSGPLPIVALTANALKGEDVRARAVGMSEYLTKPVQLRDLKRCLTQWLPDPQPHGPQIPAAACASGSSAQTAGATGNECSAIDTGVLRELVGDDDSVVMELLRDFEVSSNRLGRDIEAAVAARSPERVRQLAHQLKSAARSVGALALGDCCAALEQSARSDDAGHWPIDTFSEALDAVLLRLDVILKEAVT